MAPSKETLEALAISEAEYEAIVERLGREPNELELGSLRIAVERALRLQALQAPSSYAPQHQPPDAGRPRTGERGRGRHRQRPRRRHEDRVPQPPLRNRALRGSRDRRRRHRKRHLRHGRSTNRAPELPPVRTARHRKRNRYLFGGVVAGISEYGNCIGIPNVGGEVVFSDSYADNPLVNAMCVGIVPADKLLSATTGAPGNLLMLVGADTGRDGIHGASGLASRSFEEERELRPSRSGRQSVPRKGAHRGVSWS